MPFWVLLSLPLTPESCTPETVIEKIDLGVRVIAGGREKTAKEGRTYTWRTMPV